jgi:branched-chain amino acid transport system substrate-binding protein
MVKKFYFGTFLLVFMLVLAGCGNKTSNSSSEGGKGDTSPGITKDTITLGMLNDFSGGAAFQGGGGEDGYQAFVDYINDQGGINGRKIKLVAEDNQYTPAGGVNGSKKLITVDKVFAIPYSIGSAPTVAIKDYINKEAVPVLGVGEGTDLFTPSSKYLFSVGTPYSYQAAIAVRYVAEELESNAKATIAFMGQDDAFGKDPLKGVELAVDAYDNTELVYTAFHKRDAVDLSDQVIQLKESGAEYLFISGNVERTGIIVKELEKQNVDLKGIFSMSLASIDNRIFEIAGTKYVDRYYGIQSFYTWDQTDQESVKKVLDILKEQGKEEVIEEKNTFFWYGWNNMALFAKALEMSGDNPTRESVIKALESFDNTEVFGTLPPTSYDENKRVSGKQGFVVKTELDSNGDVVWKAATEFMEPPKEVIEELGF